MLVIKKFWSAVRRWSQGVYVSWENDPGSIVVFIGGECRRHWTSEALRACWSYFVKNQIWLIPTAVAVAGVIEVRAVP